MPTLHLYVANKCFKDNTHFEEYIDPNYDEDGDFFESSFMKEVQLEEYEPMCIEKVFIEDSIPAKDLLEGASYFEQWLKKVETDELINSAVIIYEPNRLVSPEKSIMKYLGEFEYIA